MSAYVKQEYDPHLLYHAINITVELEYKIPMQKVYDILVVVEKNNKKSVDKISPKDVLILLETLGKNLEEDVLNDENGSEDSLQSKIKELLRLMGCELSDHELNKILKGEITLDSALSKRAKAIWLIVFEQDDHGKYKPNKEMVDHMLFSAAWIANESVELKMQNSIEHYRIQRVEQLYRNNPVLRKSLQEQILEKTEKEKNDPAVLEKKRNKLRLYIAHMQGYDRDRDRDGGRGVDMTTGHVIDFGDIYIADKSHGSVIEDVDRDGIDMSDIK